MLDLHRNSFKWLEKAAADCFSPLPITPNQYSFASIVLALACFYFLAKQSLFFALCFFILAVFLDLIDGAVARRKNLATKKGAYLDTIFDRYVEAIILFGFLFLPLPEIFFPSYIWIFLILFGSMMTTYSKSAAKEKELVKKELKGGLMSRAERNIFYFFAIGFGLFCFEATAWILAAAAILTNFTAVQRIRSAAK
ncbi:MAG: CDP-alcohol phosphatidyltransferase family protein [Candidatus Paceibacterota bacterium]|jgi:phosphatidylglycerophosphate synthase|nr:CDP-alcohol phosphatidyltransferase family protein [Candidatus Paceibacterota bacterium]MDD4830531.1 CDP-alcohol phosphatidyltransferase family protein [Candidatus Paceibacterota bacterium]MDD4874800.1 CDP-alcohol phosphatidyltransferase family protein [Candidatus Paceibacterota bacterium]